MIKGLVIRSTGSWYDVRQEDATIVKCRIQGKFRVQGIKSTNPIAVGDWVEFDMEQDETGVIREIMDRKNYIKRKSVNLSKRSHILASNLDQVILLVTVKSPTTSTGFIDRFLVSAEAYRIPVKIVFNKIDLLEGSEKKLLTHMEELYGSIGYDTFRTSAIERIGLDDIQEVLKAKVTLISGHSGVGKSTLVNAIDENLSLKTGEISEAHNKGRHTTTFAEMFEWKFGGFVVDTPGIKGFGVVDIEKRELGHYFPEFRLRMQECKFNNCQHINEPQCAVLDAIEQKQIPAERYVNYLAMYNDEDGGAYREKGY